MRVNDEGAISVLCHRFSARRWGLWFFLKKLFGAGHYGPRTLALVPKVQRSLQEPAVLSALVVPDSPIRQTPIRIITWVGNKKKNEWPWQTKFTRRLEDTTCPTSFQVFFFFRYYYYSLTFTVGPGHNIIAYYEVYRFFFNVLIPLLSQRVIR